MKKKTSKLIATICMLYSTDVWPNFSNQGYIIWIALVLIAESAGTSAQIKVSFAKFVALIVCSAARKCY